MSLPEPEISLIAEIDQAVHDNEHTDRPDWCLDGAVPPTVMSTEHGSLAVHHDACRYCLADQAAAIGLSAALEAYLNTPPPPGPTREELEKREAMRRARDEANAALIAEQEAAEAAYLATLDPASREVYDVLDREVFRYHYYDDDVKAQLVTALAAAVRRGDLETTRGAHAPEQPGEFPPPLVPDVPLFTIEPEGSDDHA